MLFKVPSIFARVYPLAGTIIAAMNIRIKTLIFLIVLAL
jgi:hypothetical protein